eukprot:CAMPEP_0184673710 /NCGR_PEP_ID=MMETSP0308-20130426/86829_1 /TAXON_ID=38269 /ORGANISM="Gloeochaete witrockiana, Strain SAG 46.84" /LENGTH=575 /DNA_ID=CAMNT_0027121225 /DNA_START=71 /DNA_END=1798 /DNA_ORIENTATION=-
MAPSITTMPSPSFSSSTDTSPAHYSQKSTSAATSHTSTPSLPSLVTEDNNSSSPDLSRTTSSSTTTTAAAAPAPAITTAERENNTPQLVTHIAMMPKFPPLHQQPSSTTSTPITTIYNSCSPPDQSNPISNMEPHPIPLLPSIRKNPGIPLTDTPYDTSSSASLVNPPLKLQEPLSECSTHNNKSNVSDLPVSSIQTSEVPSTSSYSTSIISGQSLPSHSSENILPPPPPSPSMETSYNGPGAFTSNITVHSPTEGAYFLQDQWELGYTHVDDQHIQQQQQEQEQQHIQQQQQHQVPHQQQPYYYPPPPPLHPDVPAWHHTHPNNSANTPQGPISVQSFPPYSGSNPTADNSQYMNPYSANILPQRSIDQSQHRMILPRDSSSLPPAPVEVSKPKRQRAKRTQASKPAIASAPPPPPPPMPNNDITIGPTHPLLQKHSLSSFSSLLTQSPKSQAGPLQQVNWPIPIQPHSSSSLSKPPPPPPPPFTLPNTNTSSAVPQQQQNTPPTAAATKRRSRRNKQATISLVAPQPPPPPPSLHPLSSAKGGPLDPMAVPSWMADVKWADRSPSPPDSTTSP